MYIYVIKFFFTVLILKPVNLEKTLPSILQKVYPMAFKECNSRYPSHFCITSVLFRNMELEQY